MVKWAGYDSEECTWEPPENVGDQGGDSAFHNVQNARNGELARACTTGTD